MPRPRTWHFARIALATLATAGCSSSASRTGSDARDAALHGTDARVAVKDDGGRASDGGRTGDTDGSSDAGSPEASSHVDARSAPLDSGHPAEAGALSDGSSGAAALDPTGDTIPDTDYPIPGGAIFMSPTGADANPGTEAAPVLTLAKAISLVPSAGTVVARGGVYRDGSTSNAGGATTSVSKTFTLQAYPHESPWFDGTNVVTAWTATGSGQWSTPWSTPSFCAGAYYPYVAAQSMTGPCAYYDEFGDPANPAAADPQMVFVDGVYVHEVTSLAAATGANFYYDTSAQVLYLGEDPSGHTVEVTARATALVVQGGPGGNVIRGIGFRRYATNEYAGNETHGAVLAGAPNMVLENDVFTRNAGAGAFISDPTGTVVRLVVAAANGANGVDGNGHSTSGGTDGLTVEDSVFNANNGELFGDGCSYSCNAAGSKLAHMVGLTLQRNIFENGTGAAKGFWCDLDCSSAVIVNNLFSKNGDTGLMYEVSNTGIIASNLMVDNGAYGLKVGSANMQIYNNTLVGNSTQVLLYDDSRSPGVDGWTDIGPDTVNVSFFNNVLSTGGMVSAWRTSVTAPNTGPDTFFAGVDYNAYYRAADSPTTVWDWRDGTSTITSTEYASCVALDAAHGLEAHCEDVTSGGDPFFVNAMGADYRIRPGSVAHGSGTTLPSAVASALGVSASASISRGALSWPGQL